MDMNRDQLPLTGIERMGMEFNWPWMDRNGFQ